MNLNTIKMNEKRQRGRPMLYNEKTILFSRKIPASKIAMISQIVDPILKSLEIKKNK